LRIRDGVHALLWQGETLKALAQVQVGS
jgi:hypothetical protein